MDYTRPLTPRQLAKLRATPVGDRGNRLARAIELAGTTKARVTDGTGFRYSYVADVEAGRWETISVANAYRFCAFFGCHIEDLFPEREREAVA